MTPLGLRFRSLLFVLTLTLLAVAAIVVGLAVGAGLPRDRSYLALLVAIGAAAAVAFPVDFAFKTKLYLDTAVIVVVVLLVPPGPAMLLVGVGTLAGHALHRPSRDPAQAFLNASQTVLQTGAASLVLGMGGWDPARPNFDRPALGVALVVAGVIMHLISVLAVSTVIALEEGVPLAWSWRGIFGEDPRAELLFLASLLMLGLLAAMIAVSQPWGLILLVAPLAGVYGALGYHVRLRREAEAARHGSDAGLGEAQRIAHVGSWEWDLASGHQRWSDETYRIFGFPPQSFAPSRDAFASCVHDGDRAGVLAGIDAAIAGGSTFGVEHRAVRSDGTERIVHQRCEVITARPGGTSRLMGTVHDITDHKTLEARLAHLAFHDPLTGLPNRALFMDRLSRALATPGPGGGRSLVPVLFLDLDGFKLVNDGFGHEAGDRLLVAVGDRLREELDPAEMLARLGGDEFAVVLESVDDLDAASRVADRLIGALRRPFPVTPLETFVTVSIGIAGGRPGTSDPMEVLRQADIALYRAKAEGQGVFALFEPAMQATMVDRLERETALRRAVERDELRLHYQPQVDLATGRIVAVEALVRWQHPELGLLLPKEFVQLSEETGLILPLGLWVLEEACRRAREWQDRFPGAAPSIGVNLSAHQLRDRGLVSKMALLLKKTGLEPRRIELEITEGVAMTDAAEMKNALADLRHLGVGVAIDDFGTGYSSLGRLRELVPDAIKIDRSFVAELGRGDGSEAIVRAVATLAHDLGLRVTAEGIEAADQVARLRRLGVNRGQGYLFAHPVPWDVVDGVMTNGGILPVGSGLGSATPTASPVPTSPSPSTAAAGSGGGSTSGRPRLAASG